MDEIKRAQKDRVVNEEMYMKLGLNVLKPIKSQNIWAGDILLISKAQWVPADMILIYSYDKDG